MAQRKVVAVAQVAQAGVQQQQRLNRRHARPGARQQAAVSGQPCIVVQHFYLHPWSDFFCLVELGILQGLIETGWYYQHGSPYMGTEAGCTTAECKESGQGWPQTSVADMAFSPVSSIAVSAISGCRPARAAKVTASAAHASLPFMLLARGARALANLPTSSASTPPAPRQPGSTEKSTLHANPTHVEHQHTLCPVSSLNSRC